jgi:methylmalonyl-CoA mutase C-terminal domain/subunit
MGRRIRVLVGKPGLDGHDRGAKVVAAALRDAGMEVVYTGLHQTPEQIVEAGVQEDVDVVALSILSGAHMTLFPAVLKLMRKHGIGDRLLTGGGIIPAEDMQTLAQMGVGRLFGPGASTQDIAAYIREWYQETNGEPAVSVAAKVVAARSSAPKARTRETTQRESTARKPTARKTTAPKTAGRKTVAGKASVSRKPIRARATRRVAKRQTTGRRAGSKR